MLKKLKLNGSMKAYKIRPSRTNTHTHTHTHTHVIFIIGDWNTKIGSQEIPGVIGEFGLGVKK